MNISSRIARPLHVRDLCEILQAHYRHRRVFQSQQSEPLYKSVFDDYSTQELATIAAVFLIAIVYGLIQIE
jgi:hypothetical protein